MGFDSSYHDHKYKWSNLFKDKILQLAMIHSSFRLLRIEDNKIEDTN